MVISIIGTGYVGLTISAVLAAIGHKVFCIDVDPKKIDFSKIRKAKKSQILIDGRNVFNRQKIESLGFKYIGIGR